MSEQGTVTSIIDRVKRNRDDRVKIGDSALRVAIAFIRIEKETALIADEMEIAARWHDEEKAMMAANDGNGLQAYSQDHL